MNDKKVQFLMCVYMKKNFVHVRQNFLYIESYNFARGNPGDFEINVL